MPDQISLFTMLEIAEWCKRVILAILNRKVFLIVIGIFITEEMDLVIILKLRM